MTGAWCSGYGWDMAGEISLCCFVHGRVFPWQWVLAATEPSVRKEGVHRMRLMVLVLTEKGFHLAKLQWIAKTVTNSKQHQWQKKGCNAFKGYWIKYCTCSFGLARICGTKCCQDRFTGFLIWNNIQFYFSLLKRWRISKNYCSHKNCIIPALILEIIPFGKSILSCLWKSFLLFETLLQFIFC